MSLPLVLIAVAILIVFIAIVEATASRLNLPQSIMLAGLGILTGTFATIGPEGGPLAPLALLYRDLPVSAQSLTFLLLPPLLFDAAFRIDARRMLDDAAPIFLLAVVAVCVSTFAVGFALAPLGMAPLVICLLLGAIVSTTDPLAVLSIFRDVGAPARLVRIVEGESLWNDAAAIALFTILLGAATTGAGSFQEGVVIFFVSGVGGLLAGAAMGFAAMMVMALTRNHPAALTSVTVALAYLSYVVCETLLGISGAMAVVAAGIVTAGRAQSGRAPASWRQVSGIWDQLSFWSNSLVFVLASFLVPTFLSGFDWMVGLAVVVLIVAAFAARALVLWGFLPLLQKAALAQHIGDRAKTLLWWGGLRGALTLVLALSVKEHADISPSAQDFVAFLATAFTLFTILVNGLTLRPLTRVLGLHRLSPFDRSLGFGARALATDTARMRVEQTASHYGISGEITEAALSAYNEAAHSDGGVPVSARARLELALVVLAQAERAALSRHGENAVISPRISEILNRETQRIREAARASGRSGYNLAARRVLRFPLSFRLALLAQRWFGLRSPLSAALAERFERLLVRRLVLNELAPFCAERIAPVLGGRVAAVCKRMLDRRADGVKGALDALNLQYPHYAAALEQRFLERIALQEEERQYRMLREEGLIGAEISSQLNEELAAANRRFPRALRLDLGVDKRALVASQPLFATLPDSALLDIARVLRTRFVVPGERIITRGERGDTVFFIASGAVEVDTGTMRITLGRGTCVGELAAFSGEPRTAHVTMLGYGELLVLQGRAFRTLLQKNSVMRREIEAIVAERVRSAATPGFEATPGPAPRAAPSV
ncbi:cation:proton antiporter [Acuticoccus sp. M5D2P5]|uniref:cation:proton antiporter n=1 Tax=Acuticoccus kalidii TaxID=2910977 RepID=UPI001F2FEB18|nr:cation:proton antiporter [Acuticoccus kalidii]MCF3932685.1 cation:proton antiporter [Acuticoccus kalidii]